MRRILARLAIVAAFLAGGCQPLDQTPVAPTPSVPVATRKPIPTSTIAPAATNTATTLPPTPTAITAFHLEHVLPADFGWWHLVDPHRADLPDLMISAGGLYRLPPDWQVARIEYAYRWWGLAEPIFDYQVIEKNGAHYLNGKNAVYSGDVSALVVAVSNLYRTSALLAGVDHTDDYPDWNMELTGLDGRRVLINSSSTGNAGAAPWNVLENGSLYAQFDGSLGAAVTRLFKSKVGQPAGAYYPDGRDPNHVIFRTSGLPNQLYYGFSGLLPVSDDFSYSADVAGHQIQGHIYGRFSIGGMGHMMVGKIDKLTGVSLSASSGSLIRCSTKTVKTTDPDATEWTFECPAADLTIGKPYDYGVTVNFGTDAGDSFETAGSLFGVAGSDASESVLSISKTIELAFETSPAMADLLKYQTLVGLKYEASIDPANPVKGVYAGEAIFAGEVRDGAGTVGYSIKTPFAIDDGTLTRWSLSQSAVDQLLNDALAVPLTARVFESASNVPLTLWYAERGKSPSLPYLIGSSPTIYNLSVGSCGSTPNVYLPEELPLRGFGFGSNWGFPLPDFVLVKGLPVAVNLSFWRNPSDILAPLLLPKELLLDGQPLFDRVSLKTNGISQPTSMTFDLHSNAGVDLKSAYDKAAAALPVKVDKTYDTFWEAKGVTFTVAQDGRLQLTACSSP